MIRITFSYDYPGHLSVFCCEDFIQVIYFCEGTFAYKNDFYTLVQILGSFKFYR